MNTFLTSVLIVGFGVLALEITSGNGLCWGQKPPLGNNSTCVNRTDLAVVLCRIRCLSCFPNQLGSELGCITKNHTCNCIKKPATTTTSTTTTAVPTEPPTTSVQPPTSSSTLPPTQSPSTDPTSTMMG